MPVLSKKFLDIQATIECGFTNVYSRVHNIIEITVKKVHFQTNLQPIYTEKQNFYQS